MMIEISDLTLAESMAELNDCESEQVRGGISFSYSRTDITTKQQFAYAFDGPAIQNMDGTLIITNGV